MYPQPGFYNGHITCFVLYMYAYITHILTHHFIPLYFHQSILFFCAFQSKWQISFCMRIIRVQCVYGSSFPFEVKCIYCDTITSTNVMGSNICILTNAYKCATKTPIKVETISITSDSSLMTLLSCSLPHSLEATSILIFPTIDLCCLF